ncbi:MAG: lipid II flippase MurJ [Candidatus Peribacteraceae bacterium]|jgi:putative peptidoglycan lipid II flippase|nr:lipid II flippase MurJ [Candidatus Peribacteraceae bacterium]
MLKRITSPLSQNRILGGAAVLACMQLGASIMGLIRDRTLAATFPGLDTVDVYIASFRPSDLCFQMMIMAGFSVALVPMLAAYHANDKNQEMHKLLSSVVSLAAFVFGVVAVILCIFMNQIAPYLVSFSGDSLKLYIDFARLALITNFLFVFGNAFGQYLITVQKYWIYGLTPMFYTLGTILGTIYLTPHVGAYGPMYGTLGGAILYVLLRLGAVGSFRITLSIHPDLKELLSLMWPRMLALGALQAQLLLFDKVASGLDVGSITINAYARNFQAVAVGVAGIALAQSAFSLLSQAASMKEKKRYYIYLRKGVWMLLAMTIPGSIALVFLAPVAASLVSLSHVLPVFALCLTFYAISIPFESINHLLLRAFYATKHTITPAIFSVINGLTAIGTAWYLAPKFGIYSLAIGFAVGQGIQLLGLAVMLPRRVEKVM